MGELVRFNKPKQRPVKKLPSPRSWFWGACVLLLVSVLAFEFGFPLVGCNVKGNISRSGERIYHIPGQEYYAPTKINWFKGERWFCSEEAARKAGWRKAMR